MADLGVVYSFCVIEASGLNINARARAVTLVAKLMRAGFVVTDSHYALTLIPGPGAGHLAHPPTMQHKSAIFTLMRQPQPQRNEVFDQAVIDALINEAKVDQNGVLEVQIA